MKLEYDLDKLGEIALSESGFLFDPATGYTYTLNGTAGVIFRCLQKKMEREEVILELSQTFEENDQADVEQDYDDFVYRLRELGVLLARQVDEDE